MLYLTESVFTSKVQPKPLHVAKERKMKKILQITFKYKEKTPQFMQAFQQIAPHYTPNGDIKGLKWKIWMDNEEEKTAGGIYLFEDAASVRAYLTGEIIGSMKSKAPSIGVSDLQTKVFDIMPELTKISGGPVD